MAKVLGKISSTKIFKKRISVRMPKAMIKDINEALISYGQKYRSKWICDALVSLYVSNSYENTVNEEWIEPGNNVIIQINLSNEAEIALNKMVEMLSKNKELKELHSAIVRTSIIQSLLKIELPKPD